jgi:hypothetical protein
VSDSEKEYAVTFSVSAAPHQAAKLRTILRDTLELAGFELTAGVTTVESWLVKAMAARPPSVSETRGQGELPVGRSYRRKGAGPQA